MKTFKETQEYCLKTLRTIATQRLSVQGKTYGEAIERYNNRRKQAHASQETASFLAKPGTNSNGSKNNRKRKASSDPYDQPVAKTSKDNSGNIVPSQP